VILQQQTMWQSAHILALIQSQPMLTLFYHVRRKPHANCDRCFLFFCGMKITTYNFSFAFIVHCLDRFHKLHFDLEILLCAAGKAVSEGLTPVPFLSYVRRFHTRSTMLQPLAFNRQMSGNYAKTLAINKWRKAT